ncbi:MAG: Sec-independent protein translocase protein TatB [Magnetococcus sp. DMHC-6]
MLGMGWSEIFVILIVALLVIGPEKLPDVARTIAKTFRSFQRMANEVRDSIQLEESRTNSRRPPYVAPQTTELETHTPNDTTDDFLHDAIDVLEMEHPKTTSAVEVQNKEVRAKNEPKQ